MVTHTYNPGAWELQAERSEVQGHRWLYNKFEVNVGHMKTTEFINSP